MTAGFPSPARPARGTLLTTMARARPARVARPRLAWVAARAQQTARWLPALALMTCAPSVSVDDGSRATELHRALCSRGRGSAVSAQLDCCSVPLQCWHAGTYNDVVAGGDCTACPSNTTTVDRGAVSAADCKREHWPCCCSFCCCVSGCCSPVWWHNPTHAVLHSPPGGHAYSQCALLVMALCHQRAQPARFHVAAWGLRHPTVLPAAVSAAHASFAAIQA
jgi:hypothetical protein